MIFLKEVIFSNLIEGFSSAEYLIVFNAIIYGFISSYFLSGWGHMIQSRSTISFSFEHLAWTIFIFFSLLTNWYGTWHRVEFINNDIWYFFLSLVTPLTYFFMTLLLFPKEKEHNNYLEYLDSNKQILFGIFALNIFMSIVNGVIYGENNWIDKQNIIRLVGALIALSGALTKKRIIHVTILVLGYFMLITFLFTIPKIS